MIPASRENISVAMFSIVAFLMMPLAIFSSKAMAPTFISLAVFLLLIKFSQKDFLFALPKLLLAGLSLLLLWAATSLLWTLDQSISANLILPLLGLFGIGVFIIGEANAIPISMRNMIEKSLISGATIAVALLLFESATGNWLIRLSRGLQWYEVISQPIGGVNIEAVAKNGIAILAILLWPVLFALWHRRQFYLAILIFAATFYLVIWFSASAALVAIIMSTIGILIVGFRKNIACILVGSTFVFLLLGAPFLIQQTIGKKSVKEIGQMAYDLEIPNSATSRLLIWRFTAERILEKPILGWGLNSARKIPGGNEKYTLQVDTPTRKNLVLFKESYMPLHPHNQGLQIWLELGAVGAILVAVIGWLFIRKIGDEKSNLALFGVVISILIFNFLSFGAWQSWWISTQFLCLSLTLILNKQEN